jgi:hypothetical protein
VAAAPQRASTRHAVQLAITVRSGERSFEAVTQNLALGGTCVALAEKLAVGSKVSVSFRLPTSDRVIEVDGDVRWSNGSETGIHFAGLRARAVWDLNHYFEQLAR